MSLRKELADWLASNAGESVHGITVEQLVVTEPKHERQRTRGQQDEDSFQAYVSRIRKEGMGGVNELIACAHAKKVRVEVFEKRGDMYVLKEDYDPPTPADGVLRLLYNGSHYDYLRVG